MLAPLPAPAGSEPATPLTLEQRRKVLRRFRALLADEAEEFATELAGLRQRPVAEKLTAEVLPLLEAAKFLEKQAARILRPRRLGFRGRPWWLWGVTQVIHRRPLGTVLVIAPGNYPLFLGGGPTLQALVAGNFVLLKPAPGTEAVLQRFAGALLRAGLPADALRVLPANVAAAHAAIERGVAKVVFTGSSANGRALLAKLAGDGTPAVMELSGEDAVIVRADADLPLAAKAIRWARTLNDGQTCMAPHAVFVHETRAEELRGLLWDQLAGGLECETFTADDEAVALVNRGALGLGAAIFTADAGAAQVLAGQLQTGFVLINDLIVPTADPRAPFGGVKGSGFGTTRGAEGLLEMTHPQVIGVRRGRNHPHLGSQSIPLEVIRLTHGRGWGRFGRRQPGAKDE